MTAAALARALLAHEAALQALPHHTHPDWLAPLGLAEPVHGAAPACGAHWAAALGVASAAPAALLVPAHRLALLPPVIAGRLLRLRALVHRRRPLRASLQPALRDAARRWLGEPGWQALMYDAPDTLHDAGLPLLPLHAMPEALAWDGYCRFAHESVWTEPGPQRLLRLRFGRAWQPPQPAAAPEPALTRWVLSRIDTFMEQEPS